MVAALTGCVKYLNVPVVETLGVTDIGPDYAVCGGNVTDDGGFAVTERGIYWSMDPNPVSNGSKIPVGNGLGQFSTTLDALTPNTQYFVCAYAINSNGTGYGNPEPFTTQEQTIGGLPCPGVPFISHGGKVYNTVQIGSQCWLKENLNIGTMIPGNQNQTDNGITEKYCYDDQATNCDKYGGLYQWDEVMQYARADGSQGICPVGWHIPTDADWIGLADFLGGWEEAGALVKETGTSHWKPENVGATNRSGFTGLPGGSRGYSGGFGYIGENGNFWTSTEYDDENTWYRFISNYNRNLTRYNYGLKKVALSVRCIMD